MAADMRAQARGVWVRSALQSMLQSNKEAASILQKYGCEAATDVTGFGCMGHLLEMVRHGGQNDIINDGDPSAVYCSLDGTCSAPGNSAVRQCSVVLTVSAVPLLPGASECIELGVLSSLQPEVRATI
jgi:selenide,water dikinase